MSEQTRRKFDQTPEDIEKMILETEDPKDRAILMVLMNVADRLVSHEEAEMTMLLEARRMIMVILFFMNAILGMVLWYGSSKLNQFEDVAITVEAHTVQLEKIKERHTEEERHERGAVR